MSETFWYVDTRIGTTDYSYAIDRITQLNGKFNSSYDNKIEYTHCLTYRSDFNINQIPIVARNLKSFKRICNSFDSTRLEVFVDKRGYQKKRCAICDKEMYAWFTYYCSKECQEEAKINRNFKKYISKKDSYKRLTIVTGTNTPGKVTRDTVVKERVYKDPKVSTSVLFTSSDFIAFKYSILKSSTSVYIFTDRDVFVDSAYIVTSVTPYIRRSPREILIPGYTLNMNGARRAFGNFTFERIYSSFTGIKFQFSGLKFPVYTDNDYKILDIFCDRPCCNTDCVTEDVSDSVRKFNFDE